MIVYNMLIHIWLILNFFTTTFCLYHLAVALAGFHKNKKHKDSEKKHTFAAIIAARNEEGVIANLVKSIKEQNYPENLIDVIVVADNCTDKTAEAAQKAGAIVLKRFNKAEVGKGFVLRFAFENILSGNLPGGKQYDAYCIFDADNLVDREFFKHMNNALCSGFEVAQGYRDMKNPSDTWISGGHSLFYWMENRFFNTARGVLGLSATINGTGFMASSKLINEIGFNTHTATEDIEFSLQCVLAGRRVGWVPDAKVYDEQPVTVSQSIRQRIRWTNGLMQCYKGYIGAFAKQLLNKPDWVLFDMFMYLMSFPMIIVGMLSGFMCFLFTVLHIFDPIGNSINLTLLGAGSVLLFWAIGYLTLLTEKKLSKDMILSVVAYPLFNFLWVFIYIICLFKRKIDWKPITHVCNISLQELESKTK